MKKLVTVIITVVLLISVFPICNAFAVTDANYLSEDMRILHYDGNNYIRANVSRFEYNSKRMDDTQLSVPESAEDNLSEYKIYADTSDGLICDIYLYYKDGSTFSASYIRVDHYDTYTLLTQEKGGNYYIEPDYLTSDVQVSIEQLYGEKTNVSTSNLYTGYYIHVMDDNGLFKYHCGGLYEADGVYYYVDYSELDPQPRDRYPYLDDYDSVPAYKITDEELISELEEMESDAIASIFGIFGSPLIGTVLCVIFASLVFGLIPFVVLALSIVLFILSKGKYKKMFAFIGGITILELMAFTVLIILIIVL